MATTSTTQQSSTTKWQQIAYWSLIPAIVLVPAWLWIGRTLFGVFGWWVLIFTITVLPIALIYQIAIKILSQYGSVKRSLTKAAATVLAVYYAAVLLFGISIVDFGDTADSAHSVLTNIGVSEFASHTISTLSGLIIIGLAATLLVLLIMDVVAARKAKTSQ